jgi:hypothetical protein
MANCCAGASTSSSERPRRGPHASTGLLSSERLGRGWGGLLDEADHDALNALGQRVRGPEQIRPVIGAGPVPPAPLSASVRANTVRTPSLSADVQAWWPGDRATRQFLFREELL